jgi:protein TonB
MTRFQKKCLVFSVGLHGLLGLILLVSAGFGERPEQTQMDVLTMIPPNILDRAGAGGGTPPSQPVQPTQAPNPQPRLQPVPQPQPQPVVRAEPVERAVPVQHLERPLPRETVEEEQPVAEESNNPIPTHHAKPHKHHEIQPTFTTASQSTSARESRDEPSSQSNARAEARRLKQIENSLDGLASDVRSSASPSTVVEVPGIGGGGEPFAGYREVIFTIYNRAWIRPDDVASRLASADVKIIVARDGTIISAELISRSGEPALDRSVRRALDAVPSLPPFPASARDEQRTFIIRFNLESKESSG